MFRKKFSPYRNKKAQVWVETVIYTLIAFVMIGLVLSYVKPKIIEMQDKKIIEESIGILEDIDNIMLSIKKVSGNKRKISLELKKGKLNIDGENDFISFELESEYLFSEPGKQIKIGKIDLLTQEMGKINKITLTNNYTGIYDIKYNGQNRVKTLGKSSANYELFITNKGVVDNKPLIDVEVN